MKLQLRFHGRIIDALGIQMYQSPVAAIAELIANAWDADAPSVSVTLPRDTSSSAFFEIVDTGDGMTFEECQNFYLSVGRNRRDDGHAVSKSGRPVLGRKGIGKFAGFGIAEVMEINTVSAVTGERTKFKLELSNLRGSAYLETEAKEVEVLQYEPPSEERKEKSGTTIKLSGLKITRRPSRSIFAKSMSRRFMLAQQSHGFIVEIDDEVLPDSETLFLAQYDFPTAYEEAERPEGLVLDGSWGRETLSDGNDIIWRFRFLENTISEEDFRGISVYCGIKVAQTPFIFQLTGGLPGQHGLSYLTGTVKADYLDQQGLDVITTERQRINWENDAAYPLLEWGQKRLKELLRLWKERRAKQKEKLLDEKVSQFGVRLDRLSAPERRTVRAALRKLAGIESLSDDQFVDLASAILTAWETGRLREIVTDISRSEDLTESVFLSLLVEARALNALNIAEVVKLKVEVIRELRRRVERKDIENSIRDFIAKNPWLIDSRWDLFRKETRLDKLLEESAMEVGLDSDSDMAKRIDLALSAGNQLLILEFMRPGLTVDRDHVSRFQLYVFSVREKLEAQTHLGLKDVSGLLVADKLDRKGGMSSLLASLEDHGMKVTSWDVLLSTAEREYEDYLDVLVVRSEHDPRVVELRQSLSTIETSRSEKSES
jgi:hypothetical protein